MSFSVLSVNVMANDIRHIVLIGIDGFSSKSIERANIPTIKSLMNEGSYTLTKRSVLPSSSAPNWASMFMGVPTEIHGYTQWGSQTPEIPRFCEYENDIFPTIFQILRQQKPDYTQGYVYEWEGMKYLADTLSFNYHEMAYDYLENKTLLADMACRYIEDSKPDMMTIIFASPDDMGHKFGFTSIEYYSELNHVDNQIARIIETYKNAGLLNETVFIVSSDHGGIEYNHGGITLDEMETPFIIVGKNIKKNYEIDGLMMQYDIASTIADLFEIEIPEIWRGKSFYDKIYDETSISSVESIIENDSNETNSIYYYDIQGNRLINSSSNGIVIRQKVYSDGKIKSEKYIRQ